MKNGQSLNPGCVRYYLTRNAPDDDDRPIGRSDKSTGGILYQLKNGCNWCDLPKDLPPYSTVYWHYKRWRTAGVFEELMPVLHQQVRQQVKKNQNGQHLSSSTPRL
ncbi:MAG: transposase [Coleofasciculaceae cyanobacterium]